MTFKNFLLIFLLAISFLPFYKINAQTSNIGLIPGNIWYSQDSFKEGDKIKIYTLIFNPENKELSGTIMFFDKDTLLGQKDFKVLAKSTEDVSVDWTVTAGKHTIYAKIEDAKFLVSTGKYETALLSKNETEKDTITVSKNINTGDTSENSDTNSSDTNTVLNLIQEKTPSFISKPIIITTDALESFRENVGEKIDTEKEKIRQELEEIKTAEIQKPAEEGSKTQKPWKQIQSFVLQLASFIFNNQYVFYTVLFILVFLVLRYIWLKIF